MPELDFAILCQGARVSPDNLMYILAGGWDTVVGPEDSVQAITIAMRVLFTQGECGRPHRLEIVVQGMDGQRLAVVTGVVAPEVIPGIPVGWKVGAMLALPIPVFFRQYGEYSVEVLVNDSSLKSLPLRFAPTPPQSAPPLLPPRPPGDPTS